ncbi:MAG: helix-turn-helix domain-containing protein [Gammaproteobacteria bacterium]|nr:helix-turn-helix domain-containing protein [Gammaproteobacteria bacterium]MBU2685780.1 helix-turn-helix domain-containing protein [Gammaproteobacteria bacterium]
MEWWTEEECRDHGRCRASSQPCWCDAEAMQALISLSEAAEYCGLAYSTLAQAIREGRLKGRRAGPKTWLTTRQAIEDAILSHKLRPRH